MKEIIKERTSVEKYTVYEAVDGKDLKDSLKAGKGK